jgi:hypothetical protein
MYSSYKNPMEVKTAPLWRFKNSGIRKMDDPNRRTQHELIDLVKTAVSSSDNRTDGSADSNAVFGNIVAALL